MSQSLLLTLFQPPYLYPVLFASALLESLFPPWPSDVVTLYGAYLVGRGKVSLSMAFLAVVTGSLLGVMVLYYLGRVKGRALFKEGRRIFSLNHLLGVEKLFARHGLWILAVNRFLAGVRAIIFIVAGVADMPPGKVWGLGAVSIVVWNALLFWLGALFGLESQGLVKRIVWIVTTLFVIGCGWLYLNLKLRREMKTG
jgi:membrane protein DedA with SNARE-associated domain